MERKSSNGKKYLFLVLLLPIFLLSAAARPPVPRGFDALVKRAQEKWEVPGIAVGVVKDGRLVFARGYGVRKKGENSPVTPLTLFGIASNTKAFTAAALGILVDRGKLRWDDPVIKHLPDFRMYDPYVTRELTVRDLLTHRSGLGLGAGDLLFWPHSTYTAQEIVYRVRFIKPRFSFRSRFAYSNIMYIVAGQIIPALTGKTWGEFIKEGIFKPLGMKYSNTSVEDLKKSENFASPHMEVEGEVVAVDYENLDNGAPAGAINSNVVDMAKWMMVQLRRGLIRKGSDGEVRLFSKETSREMWSAQIPIPIREYPPELSDLQPNFFAYGLGWMLRDYHGHKLVYHTGSIKGMVSSVVLVPDLQLGIVVLTNQEVRQAYQAIIYSLLDYYMGLPSRDWVGAFSIVRERVRKRMEKLMKTTQVRRVKNTRPSLSLSQYAGRYVDRWYGDMVVEKVGEKLVMRFCHTPSLVGELQHWHYDTFVVRWKDRSLHADAFVTFVLNYRGEIEEVKMAPFSPLTDFSFDFRDLLFVPVKRGRSRIPH